MKVLIMSAWLSGRKFDRRMPGLTKKRDKCFFAVLAPVFVFFVAVVPTVTQADTPIPCHAVDALAQVFVPDNGLIFVDMVAETDRNICSYSINGATPDTSVETSDHIQQAKIHLVNLMNYASGANRDESLFDASLQGIKAELPYILVAANLKDAALPSALKEILVSNEKLVDQCFLEFYYYGKSPSLESESMSCGVYSENLSVLRTVVHYESHASTLLTFR